MQEVIINENKSLLEIPRENQLIGIILPTSSSLTKDGLGDIRQYDTRFASQKFRINRLIGEYTKKYGARVFYLGTYQNRENGKFRLFSFPVRNFITDTSDVTIISRSCEQLLSTIQKFPVSTCLLPMFAEDLGYQSFQHCVKPVLDMSFDEKFIMVHRRGIQNG